MATRTRVSVVPAREKRGTSPSHAPHHTAATAQHHRTSPNTSKTNSPTPTHDSATSLDKHVPNYLKATQSSGPDISKQQGKKPVSNEVNQNKPNVARRRSLDKPSSHLTTQKPHASPNPAPRSSSGVGKTVHSSSRMVPDKNLRAGKESGKQGGGSLYARPDKKTTIYLKKGTRSGTSSTTKEKDTTTPVEKVENDNKPDLVKPETKNEEQVSSVIKHEEHAAVDETNHEKKDDFSAKDGGLINIEKTEADDANIVNVESPTVAEKHDLTLDVKTEELDPEEKLQIEETDSKNEEIENATIESSVAENPNEEVVEKGEPAVLNHKEEDGFGSAENNEITEKVQVVVAAKEEKKEAFKPQVAAAQVGKKDSSAVSNDVIEETASKLREQRKNKVKALAGAFETVISLQEQK